MQRTNQGGSVISFVVICVVLILMLIDTIISIIFVKTIYGNIIKYQSMKILLKNIMEVFVKMELEVIFYILIQMKIH